MNKEETITTLLNTPGCPLAAELRHLFQTIDPVEMGDEEKNNFAIPVQLTLRSGARMEGALSVRESGAMRLLQQGEIRDPRFQHAPAKPIIAEWLFSAFDIEAIIIIHAIKAQPQTKASPIILGG